MYTNRLELEIFIFAGWLDLIASLMRDELEKFGRIRRPSRISASRAASSRAMRLRKDKLAGRAKVRYD